MATTNTRPPLPPFTAETAAQKIRMAEDAWNSRDPHKVSLAYTPDSRWRNRAEFVNGRAEIVQFLGILHFSVNTLLRIHGRFVTILARWVPCKSS